MSEILCKGCKIGKVMRYDAAINFLKQSDPIIGILIQQVGPCLLNASQEQGDLFSSLARAIIHQQLSTKAAASIHCQFLRLYPHKPSPITHNILNSPDELLRGAGLSRAKVLYLKDLAHKIVDGLPTLIELEAMDDETIIQTLLQVKGIGRWTAQMLLIFRLNRQDVLPVARYTCRYLQSLKFMV